MLVACKSCRRQYDVEGMKAGERVRCRCGLLVEVPREAPRVARTLHCASCGGKVREGSRLCEYCGSEVALAERHLGPACPECFARLALGARFCSGCGVKIQPEALKATRESSGCPRCEAALVLVELPQGLYTECSSCGGIWLDAQRFERVVAEKDAAALETLFPASRRAAAPGREPPPQPVKYLRCPVCGAFMNRKNFAGCSGVVIDWCKGHGVWFDVHEIEKVIEFVASGGLDKARQLEVQRQKREIERLQETRRAVAGVDWGRQPDHGADWIAGLLDVASTLSGLFR